MCELHKRHTPPIKRENKYMHKKSVYSERNVIPSGNCECQFSGVLPKNPLIVAQFNSCRVALFAARTAVLSSRLPTHHAPHEVQHGITKQRTGAAGLPVQNTFVQAVESLCMTFGREIVFMKNCTCVGLYQRPNRTLCRAADGRSTHMLVRLPNMCSMASL